MSKPNSNYSPEFHCFMSKNGSRLSQHDSIETPSDKAGAVHWTHAPHKIVKKCYFLYKITLSSFTLRGLLKS